MASQVTLLTSHKGVDLHAATAVRVIRDRLEGGDRLLGLGRAEFHTFWEASAGNATGEAPTVAGLLATGRAFNPNKHHYGHFRLHPAEGPWWEGTAARRGEPLPAGWPGEPVATDRGPADAGLLDRLLGGGGPAGSAVVDVCAFPLDEPGPLVSGVLWRLTLAAAGADPAALAQALAVTRGAGRGLLVNPHMEGWRLAVRGGAAGRVAG